MKRALLLIAILCSISSTADAQVPSGLQGAWQVTTIVDDDGTRSSPSATTAFVFAFPRTLVIAQEDDAGADLEASTCVATFRVTGDQLSVRMTEETCPGAGDELEQFFRLELTGDRLTLHDAESEARNVFRRIGAAIP